MEKYLIVYSDTEIITITNVPEGTAVVTPYRYVVETLENAKLMLSILGIDTSKIDEYKPIEE